ncbi:MAG: DNRLRE domain-containing protein [candidate division WOR-3 bacterium]|nr:MAG: DNRLRE domain-containing protein [candidate division WOR-3 bacterium]
MNRLPAAPLACLMLALLALPACNSLPVGYGQLGRIPSETDTTIGPDTAIGFARYVALGTAERLYLGYDSAYESRVLLRFGLPDSDLGSVRSLKLVLYRANDVQMGFEAYPCSVSWDEYGATWKSASLEDNWLEPGGDMIRTRVLEGTLKGDSAVFDIDLEHLELLVRESYGIFLIPKNSGFTAIHGRTTEGKYPRMVMTYAGDNDVSSTAAADVHLVDTTRVDMGPVYLAVGSGVAFRTYLKFDVGSLPGEGTVAKAEMAFLPEVQYRRQDTLAIGIHRLLEPFEDKGPNSDFREGAYDRLRYVVSPDTDSVARLDIRALVQYWTAHPDSNFGCYLMAEPEYAEFFRMRIPMSGPSSPKLELLHVTPPQDRF